jgi:hypothetical protein
LYYGDFAENDPGPYNLPNRAIFNNKVWRPGTCTDDVVNEIVQNHWRTPALFPRREDVIGAPIEAPEGEQWSVTWVLLPGQKTVLSLKLASYQSVALNTVGIQVDSQVGCHVNKVGVQKEVWSCFCFSCEAKFDVDDYVSRDRYGNLISVHSPNCPRCNRQLMVPLVPRVVTAIAPIEIG